MNKSINFYLDKFFGIELIRSRPKEAIKFAKNYFKNKKIIAVEIGVFRGQNSEDIIRNLNISKIYLIDPYLKYDGYKNAVYSNFVASAEAEARKRLNKFSKKISWIKNYSENAIGMVQKNIDFIYIDANHEYKYIKKDLELYWEKLSMGGIMAGHDIQVNSVSKALLEFAKKKSLQINFGDRRDWWIIK